jgi:hypothetical protein
LVLSLTAAAAGAGWGRDAHEVVTREAAANLPPPLSTAFGAPQALDAIQSHVMGPDRRVDQLRTEAQQLQQQADAAAGQADHEALASKAQAAWARYRSERSKHFFDIDAVTDEPPPYAGFPRDRREAAIQAAEHLLRHEPRLAAELLGENPDQPTTTLDGADRSRWPQLGEAAMARFGTLPWVIRDQVARLTEAFRQGRHERTIEAIADLSHFVADLHQPLHTTRNYDGQLTGNRGIHAAFEIYLVIRRKALSPQEFERLPPELVPPYDAVDDVVEAVMRQVARNAEWARRLLEADTEARRLSGAGDEDFAFLKTLDRDVADDLFRRTDPQGLDARRQRLLRHVDELSRLLAQKHDDLPQVAMGQAASMLSSMIYTAWIQAGRPALAGATAEAAPAAKDAAPSLFSFDMIVFGAVAALLLMMLLRRRRRPAPQ